MTQTIAKLIARADTALIEDAVGLLSLFVLLVVALHLPTLI